MRAVLLIRPDIYASLGLQNQNTKIRDNAVLLDWSTTYRDYRSSAIFKMADQLLAHQQTGLTEEYKVGEAWDYYFPWDAPTEQIKFEKKTSFISFLRFALYRPRDIVTMLTMLQERFVNDAENETRSFNQADFDNSTFRRNYADYLLGEVKDQLSFYYSDQDYESFLKFFTYLNGKNKFTYDEYSVAYKKHVQFIEKSAKPTPKFMASKEEFLQFLYELNVICYFEVTDDSEKYIHWCFKDRTYSNISPKIKTDKEYEIFYGMAKALNVGKHLKSDNSGINLR